MTALHYNMQCIVEQHYMGKYVKCNKRESVDFCLIKRDFLFKTLKRVRIPLHFFEVSKLDDVRKYF